MNWIWLLALLVLFTFAPRFGVLVIYKDWRSAKEREQLEDALKHLLDREGQGRHASPESLAGTLSLPRAKTTRLICDMESQGLLETQGSQLHLTAEGEHWAMYVVPQRGAARRRDHLIFIGRVEGCSRQHKAPLLFHGGRYRVLGDA